MKGPSGVLVVDFREKKNKKRKFGERKDAMKKALSWVRVFFLFKAIFLCGLSFYLALCLSVYRAFTKIGPC